MMTQPYHLYPPCTVRSYPLGTVGLVDLEEFNICYTSLEDRMIGSWQLLWCAIVLSIWSLRNTCIFRDGTFDGAKLMEESLFWAWT